MAINDFGEKIGGAKKDLWKERNMIIDDLTLMNAAEKITFIKKDNVWKKPDYQTMVDYGLPIKVAWFIKTVRDSLGAKPVFGYYDDTPEAILEKQEAYISFVGTIRDATMNCKTEQDILALGKRSFLIENDFIEDGNSRYVRPTERAGGCITNKFLRAFIISNYDLNKYSREIERKQFLFTEEQKILSDYEFYKYENVTWEKDFRDKLYMKINHGYGSTLISPKQPYDKEYSWQEGTWFVLDKSRNIIRRNVATKEEAEKMVIDSVKSRGAPSSGKKAKRKGRFIPPQLQHIERTGENYRHGIPVTGQDYLDVFGFKGGEFGNWMTEKDRQASLDFGYDALYDLAKALKIEPRDISLGNSLSIAFGARGSGSAMAHYESMREVINLTKMKGAGSLAHEWAHALDNIIAGKIGLSRFMTSDIHREGVPESLFKLVRTMEYKDVNGNKWTETDFYKNSKTFDAEFSKTDHGYWASTEEMFARAFACYVYDRVEGRSDYLCAHANIAISNGVPAFPTGEEREAINKCFDELFIELKEMGYFHHKEDFTVAFPQKKHESSIEWHPGEVENAYQLSFADLIENACERAKSANGTVASKSIDEKGFDR